MPKTEIKSRQIGDGQVCRADVNVTDTGKALVRKVLAGSGILTMHNGVDDGTGDVIVTVKGLSVASNKTLSVSNSLTLVGTDSTTMTFPAADKTLMASDYSNAGTAPTWNQDTTGSTLYWKTSGTGKAALVGPSIGTRTYTLPDADATIVVLGGALGTPSGGTLTNCTFPTLNQNTTGSAAYWKTSGTGKAALIGPATGTTRTYTLPDADSTILTSVLVGTAATDGPTYGTEFMDGVNWTATGWTGSFAVGFTHTVGNTTALTFNLAPTVSTRYKIVTTVTGWTAGSANITIGGKTSFLGAGTIIWIPTAATTAAFTITPTTGFDGTIVVSMKPVTAATTPFITAMASNSTVEAEFRFPNINFSLYIGTSAGQYASGLYNTMVGASTGANVTSGNTNTGVGMLVLTTLTTGNSNTGIGVCALQYIDATSSNTALGYYAGRHISGGSVNNTASVNCIFLGARAYPLTDGDTNEIVIGADAVGAGSNTVVLGNTSIIQTTLRGHIVAEGVTTTGATGTGKLVFDTSPVLVTPNLGTPSAAVLTNASGTAANLVAGNTTNPAPQVIVAAKGALIAQVFNIVTPVNVKGFWIFDQTGAISIITDRNTIGGGTAHPVTLRNGSLAAINASTLTPGVSGLAPYLSFDSTHLWNTPDSNDFSFGNGATDTPFSVITLANINDVSQTTSLVAKLDLTTAATQKEWALNISNTLRLNCYDDSSGGIIGRYYNVALTAYNGVWAVYGCTKSSGITAAAIKIYLNGVQVDDTNSNAGSYTAMENKAAAVGNYTVATGGTISLTSVGKQSVVLIISEELTAVKMAQLDALLRSYAGVAL